MRATFTSLLAITLACSFAACGGDDTASEPVAPAAAAAPPALPGVEAIDDARLVAAASEPQSWLTYGGTYAEQRLSTLEQINASNVAQLGLACSLRHQHDARPRGDADRGRRRDVHDRLVERRLRARRADGQGALALRPEGAAARRARRRAATS